MKTPTEEKTKEVVNKKSGKTEEKLTKFELNDNKINFFDFSQFEAVQRVAKMFIHSDLVPDMYRATDKNNADKALANTIIALDMAQRIGANPLMVMQNLSPIKGKPSWSATFLISSVNTSKKFTPLKFSMAVDGNTKGIKYTEYQWKNGSNTAVEKTFSEQIDNITCYAYAWSTKIPEKERNQSNVLKGATISIKMAIQEGWYTKAGSKWITMPEQMLMYRAASFWTRAYAPEISMGMYTADEAEDIVDVDYEEIIDNEIEENANKEFLDVAPDESQQEDEHPEGTDWENPTSIIAAIGAIESTDEFNQFKKVNKKRLEVFDGEEKESIDKALEEKADKVLRGF